MKVPQEFIALTIGAFAGIAKYLYDYNKTGIFQWKHMMAGLIVAMFAGYCAHEFSIYMNMNENLSVLFVSVSSWSGGQMIQLFEDWLKKKLFS